ncbi:GNAT family N-acetyltransferase [Vagococcus fessus]|uniref:GNAT family N-acetyltransferase n=1 Tax=Vagococcus fessus TaxID=120370 RepID=UPI0039E8C0FD
MESNTQSLLEAVYDNDYCWTPKAILHNQNYIGFTMYGDYNIKDKSIWLDRFMIDSNFQGLGYGKASLDFIIKYLKENFNLKIIYLSVHDTNSLAIQLYETFGFFNTQNIDPNNDELIFSYTV